MTTTTVNSSHLSKTIILMFGTSGAPWHGKSLTFKVAISFGIESPWPYSTTSWNPWPTFMENSFQQLSVFYTPLFLSLLWSLAAKKHQNCPGTGSWRRSTQTSSSARISGWWSESTARHGDCLRSSRVGLTFHTAKTTHWNVLLWEKVQVHFICFQRWTYDTKRNQQNERTSNSSSC